MSRDSLSVLQFLTEMLQGQRGNNVPGHSKDPRSPSLRLEPFPRFWKLVRWARSVRGGVRDVQEELRVQLHCGFALL